MASLKRRKFLKSAGAAAAGIGGAPWITKSLAQRSPNDTINIAVMGIRSRGRAHMSHFGAIRNVRVATLCDIDERLFAERVKSVEESSGSAPSTETDIRRVLDDKDIDAVSVAAPNHWHALASVWACQAGKDVYVEKPISWSITEGRKIIEAADKYKRIVQTGSQRRSDPLMQEAVKFIQSGELGRIYMVKACVYRFRNSIGHGSPGQVPPGVHYDRFRGPAPMVPFSENRFHYQWHWFWDTGNGETGNNGPHPADLFKWAMQRTGHPQVIQSMGGIYVHDTEQETPTHQMSVYKYRDGLELQLEVRNHFTNRDADVREGLIFYGSEGWMQFNLGNTWRTYFGREDEPGPSMTREQANEKYGSNIRYGKGWEPHFANFIDCMRSRKAEDLMANAEQGHFAATICHLGNIAYRTGRTLTFDSATERFVGDDDANRHLLRDYRAPYVMPERV